jgi:hypothetical protein
MKRVATNDSQKISTNEIYQATEMHFHFQRMPDYINIIIATDNFNVQLSHLAQITLIYKISNGIFQLISLAMS